MVAIRDGSDEAPRGLCRTSRLFHSSCSFLSSASLREREALNKGISSTGSQNPPPRIIAKAVAGTNARYIKYRQKPTSIVADSFSEIAWGEGGPRDEWLVALYHACSRQGCRDAAGFIVHGFQMHALELVTWGQKRESLSAWIS